MQRLILIFMQTMDSKIEEGNPATEEAGKVKKDDGIEQSQKVEAILVKIMEVLTLKNDEKQEKKSKLIPIVFVLILINILIFDLILICIFAIPGNLQF